MQESFHSTINNTKPSKEHRRTLQCLPILPNPNNFNRKWNHRHSIWKSTQWN